MRDAILMKAALVGADLWGARMVKARLGLSNLQGARLDGADMRGIRGKYAVWREANWWDAIMDESLTKALSKKWPKDQSVGSILASPSLIQPGTSNFDLTARMSVQTVTWSAIQQRTPSWFRNS